MGKNKFICVSVIIPSYDSRRTIDRCLDSILNQSTEAVYEVIVVDSSDDGVSRIIRDKCKSIRFIGSNDRLNPAQARNIGIKHSRGELVALMDADCVAEKTWLEMIIELHRNEPYLIIGGPVKRFSNSTTLGRVQYLIEFSEFLPNSRKMPVSFVPTCNASYKREVFEKFGYFPTEMDCSEDVLFHRRITAQGRKILFDPLIAVSHISRTNFKGFSTHLFKIGFWTAKARKKADFLKGAFLIRIRCLIPLLFVYKLIAVLVRNLKRDTKSFLFIIICFPLVSLAILIWVYGFWKGAIPESAEQH